MKIKPIARSYSSDNNSMNHRHQQNKQNKQKRVAKNTPAATVTINSPSYMKQLQLPFDDIDKADLKIFELYQYRDPRARYKTYGSHVDYTVAKSMNEAEDLFSKAYPNWWKAMGVKEADVTDVQKKLEFLEEQVATCRIVLHALILDEE